MKCLSVRQPWAWLLTHPRSDNPSLPLKDVENRTWATDYRGPLLIHAGQRFDYEGWNWVSKDCMELITGTFDVDEWARIAVYHRGSVIVGQVNLVDIIFSSSSPWAASRYFHWIVEKPVAFAKPIPFKGKLRIFEVPEEVLDVKINVPRGY